MTLREKAEQRRDVSHVRLDGTLAEVLPRFVELIRDGATVVCFAQMDRGWKVVVDLPDEGGR